VSARLSVREIRILSRIEAEFRRSDPQFPALFSPLPETGCGQRTLRHRAGMRWVKPLAVLLTVLALALTAAMTGTRIAGWKGCSPARSCPGITGFAHREVAALETQTARWGREIRVQLCQSSQVGWPTVCG
jgi:hypothetical protein